VSQSSKINDPPFTGLPHRIVAEESLNTSAIGGERGFKFIQGSELMLNPKFAVGRTATAFRHSLNKRRVGGSAHKQSE
jgi:hypothetical protein